MQSDVLIETFNPLGIRGGARF